jgi:hypothetical protein
MVDWLPAITICTVLGLIPSTYTPSKKKSKKMQYCYYNILENAVSQKIFMLTYDKSNAIFK